MPTPSRQGLQEAAFAITQDRVYEAAVDRSPNGKLSKDIRARGRALAATGHSAEAFEAFSRAASLHPAEDNSAAASAARHDLAKEYLHRRQGVRLENLLAARRLLERALECPERQAHPLRHASTLNLLGICQRQLAAESHDKSAAGSLLDAAERSFRTAIERVQRVDIVGWKDAADYWGNLGNLLREQRQDLDRAIAAYEKALELRATLDQSGSDNRWYRKEDGWNGLPLTAAAALRRRNRKNDLARAQHLVEEVLRDGLPRFADQARIELAEIHLAHRTEEGRGRARRELGRLVFEDLPPGRLNQVVQLYVRMKLQKEALSILYRVIDAAFTRRSSAMAPHEADHASRMAQQAAGEAARLHADRGEHAAAFMVLENTSGVRFTETVSFYNWHPSDPSVRLLWEHWKALQQTATGLAGAASMLAYASGESVESVIEALSNSNEVFDSPSDADVGDALLHVLKEAARTSDPRGFVERQAQDIVTQLEPIARELFRLAPAGSRAIHPTVPPLTGAGMEVLTRAQPNDVFVRLHWQRDLLVVALWHDGKPQVRSARLHVPKELLEQLRGVERGFDGPRGAGAVPRGD